MGKYRLEERKRRVTERRIETDIMRERERRNKNRESERQSISAERQPV